MDFWARQGKISLKENGLQMQMRKVESSGDLPLLKGESESESSRLFCVEIDVDRSRCEVISQKPH